MPVVQLDDLADPRLDPYRSLKIPTGSRTSELFIAEGQTLAERLLASDYEVDSCLIVSSHLERIENRVPDTVPIYVISKEQAQELIGYPFHRGILVCGRRRPGPTVNEFLKQHVTGQLRLAVCVNIADPENLGSLIRISAALGMQGLLLSPDCCDPFSRRTLRVSMGTGLRVPLIQCHSLTSVMTELQQANVVLAASTLSSASVPLSEIVPPSRVAVLFGNEGQGLPSDITQQCDLQMRIPMKSGVDSLNVAVAAGIILYHFCQA